MVNLQKQFLLLLLGITVVPREIQENALFFREAGVGGGGGETGCIMGVVQIYGELQCSNHTKLRRQISIHFILQFYRHLLRCYILLYDNVA